MNTDLSPPAADRKKRFSGPFWLLWWYLEWAIPGLGMFSEAYIVFCECPIWLLCAVLVS